MHPATFQYKRAETIEEAIELLGSSEEARLLAGGHSLLPLMKLRMASPALLIDIGRIAALRGIEREGDRIRIGALTTHGEMAASEEVRRHCPILAETASVIGDLQVRARGTIGGSLAHADPAADYPPTVLALGATVVVRGPDGEREVTADDFFVDVLTTSLAPQEVVTAVTVPVLAEGTGTAYLKHPHPASSYAVVGVAAMLSLDGGTCSDVRLAVGGATGRPVRATAAEEALAGEEPSEEAFARAAGRVADALQEPIGDLYASEEYRVHLAGVLAERALARAAERAS